MMIWFQPEEESRDKRCSTMIYEIRDTQTSAKSEQILSFSGLTIFPKERRVTKNGKEILLTYTEFNILHLLMRHSGQVFSHEQIYNAIDERHCGMEGVDNIIYCLIRSLRKKIETDPRHPRYIHTVRSVGYKFAIF